jgi:uncharacterized protein (DUF433 family)
MQLRIQNLSGHWSGIERTSNICGGDARIANTRIPVWVLVQARDWGHSDAAAPARLPHPNGDEFSQCLGLCHCPC